MYILTILLEKKEIRKEEIVETIDVSDTVFHRYMQEVRAFLYNFNLPYQLKYSRSALKIIYFGTTFIAMM